MCLAIVKPKHKQIKLKYLRNAFQANPDGAGMAWSDGKRIHTLKGIFDADRAVGEYMKRQSYPMLIHFRWATHGSTVVDNCHPFLMCDGQYALIHNGVIGIKTSGDMTDTETFARQVLEPALKAGASIHAPWFKFLVEQAVGSYNKIAIMDVTGNVAIMNEDEGQWHNGTWYSNSDYRSPRCEYRGYTFGYDTKKDDDYQPRLPWDAFFCNHCQANLLDVLVYADEHCPYCQGKLSDALRYRIDQYRGVLDDDDNMMQEAFEYGGKTSRYAG